MLILAANPFPQFSTWCKFFFTIQDTFDTFQQEISENPNEYVWRKDQEDDFEAENAPFD